MRVLLSRAKKQVRKIRMDYANTAGWKTNKKYVVIESDDWGSIRTASKEAYLKKLASGDKIDSDPFTRYDALASEDDLSLLFDVLYKYKDMNDIAPVLTANCVMANPDFDKIKESDFQEYFYEPFTETLSNYPKHSKSFSLWKEGMNNGVFYPQLHCREHVNVVKWMEDLRSGHGNLRLAFEHRMISGGNAFSPDNPYAYMDAFNYRESRYNKLIREILSDASTIFEQTFGYKSKSFIPSCCVWSDALEQELNKINVEYIQGGRQQHYPSGVNYSDFTKIDHTMGERNKFDQIYTVRNCYFEPALFENYDSIDICMSQIDSAFRKNKPAVIGSHRLNYIGYINEDNRDKNLILLNDLLSQILKKWPDIEFTTSDKLGDMIKGVYGETD